MAGWCAARHHPVTGTLELTRLPVYVCMYACRAGACHDSSRMAAAGACELRRLGARGGGGAAAGDALRLSALHLAGGRRCAHHSMVALRSTDGHASSSTDKHAPSSTDKHAPRRLFCSERLRLAVAATSSSSLSKNGTATATAAVHVQPPPPPPPRRSPQDEVMLPPNGGDGPDADGLSFLLDDGNPNHCESTNGRCAQLTNMLRPALN
jgi:hypothetical protein